MSRGCRAASKTAYLCPPAASASLWALGGGDGGGGGGGGGRGSQAPHSQSKMTSIFVPSSQKYPLFHGFSNKQGPFL